MAVKYRSERPVKGLLIHYTEDEKFNTEAVVIRFITPLDEVKAQQYTMISALLSETCRKYPEKADFSKRQSYLYGASVNCTYYDLGGYMICGLSVNSISDRFTINGEEITEDCAKMLLDCIFDPNISDGKFCEKYFDQKLRQLKNAIKSDINNRRSYALRRAKKIAFENEPMSVSVKGTLENAEKITNEGLVKAYRELLENSYISVSFTGRGENVKAQKLIKERLTEFVSGRETNVDDIEDLNFYSEIKSEPKFITEEIEQSQSKLVLFYKSACRDQYANDIACAMLGGTPFSKLFENVREKLSLCYYCQSHVVNCTGAVLVDCGVEKGNEEKALKEIFAQLKALQNGDFSDEELENTKKYLNNLSRLNYDTVEGMNSWYFSCFAKGEYGSPDDYIAKINAVTREDVIEAFKQYRLDTVYSLVPSAASESCGENGGEDDA